MAAAGRMHTVAYCLPLAPATCKTGPQACVAPESPGSADADSYCHCRSRGRGCTAGCFAPGLSTLDVRQCPQASRSLELRSGKSAKETEFSILCSGGSPDRLLPRRAEVGRHRYRR